jgi:hypothetical protein
MGWVPGQLITSDRWWTRNDLQPTLLSSSISIPRAPVTDSLNRFIKKIEEEKKKRRHLNRIFRIYQMLPLLHKACNVAYHLAGNYELTTITNGWQWP